MNNTLYIIDYLQKYILPVYQEFQTNNIIPLKGIFELERQNCENDTEFFEEWNNVCLILENESKNKDLEYGICYHIMRTNIKNQLSIVNQDFLSEYVKKYNKTILEINCKKNYNTDLDKCLNNEETNVKLSIFSVDDIGFYLEKMEKKFNLRIEFLNWLIEELKKENDENKL
jgi:hypothetical protein